MKKYTSSNMSPLKSLAIGTAASLGIIAVLAFLSSLLSSFTADPTSLCAIMSLISLLASGAVYGIISYKLLNMAVTASLLSALISVIPMLIAGIMIKGGIPGANVFLNYLAFLGTVTLSSSLIRRLGAKKRYY